MLSVCSLFKLLNQLIYHSSVARNMVARLKDEYQIFHRQEFVFMILCQ